MRKLNLKVLFGIVGVALVAFGGFRFWKGRSFSVGMAEGRIPASSGMQASPEEIRLASIINDYRAAQGLNRVPLSQDLSAVAQFHVRDLSQNMQTVQTSPCNMHSWPGQGKWKTCCYAPDHSNQHCMIDKPRELTDYQGYGYEIVAWQSPRIDAETALRLWQNSPAHDMVLRNSGNGFERITFNAMGVAIYGKYAAAWFGKEADPKGAPVVNQTVTTVPAKPGSDAVETSKNAIYSIGNFFGGLWDRIEEPFPQGGNNASPENSEPSLDEGQGSTE